MNGIFSKKVFAAFLGLCLLAAAPAGQAQEAHPGQRIQEIFRELNLTDAQKHQLQVNKRQHRQKLEIDRQELKELRGALREELMRPQLDMPKVHQIHGQIKALQDQMEDDRLDSILTVRTILTPDQFLKFSDLMRRFKPPEHPEHGPEPE